MQRLQKGPSRTTEPRMGGCSRKLSVQRFTKKFGKKSMDVRIMLRKAGAIVRLERTINDPAKMMHCDMNRRN